MIRIETRSHLERYPGAAHPHPPAIQVHNDWTLHNIIVAADGVDYIVDFNSTFLSESSSSFFFYLT